MKYIPYLKPGMHEQYVLHIISKEPVSVFKNIVYVLIIPVLLSILLHMLKFIYFVKA